jgi:putative sterol carrier protein
MPQTTEIRHVLLGRTDEEIVEWVRSVGGSNELLEQAFLGMKEAFHADRAAGQSALIRWDIATPEGRVATYEVEVADGECTVSHGAHGNARVVLAMPLADFLRLVTGCLDGLQAYEAGKLRVTGDLSLARMLTEWFQETH